MKKAVSLMVLLAYTGMCLPQLSPVATYTANLPLCAKPASQSTEQLSPEQMIDQNCQYFEDQLQKKDTAQDKMEYLSIQLHGATDRLLKERSPNECDTTMTGMLDFSFIVSSLVRLTAILQVTNKYIRDTTLSSDEIRTFFAQNCTLLNRCNTFILNHDHDMQTRATIAGISTKALLPGIIAGLFTADGLVALYKMIHKRQFFSWTAITLLIDTLLGEYFIQQALDAQERTARQPSLTWVYVQFRKALHEVELTIG